MKPIRRTRRDSTQKDIVAGLERCGWNVWVIGWPCDLLCYRRDKGFRTLEAKRPKSARNAQPKLDKRQREQADFCTFTNTPYVTNIEQALIEVMR